MPLAKDPAPGLLLVPRAALGRPPPRGPPGVQQVRSAAPERGQQAVNAPRSGHPGWLPSRDGRTDGSRKNKTRKQHVSPFIPSSGRVRAGEHS